MLKVTIPAVERYDEIKNEFNSSKETALILEHSLVSLSKWESKWCKPFFSKDEKSSEETIDYIRCMTITKNVDQEIYNAIPNSIIDEINRYIHAPMTATTINRTDGQKNRSVVTSELIYYWMIALNIPFECQKWHLNRLIMLINVCDIKSKPSKKMSRREITSRNRALNAARRKSLNTKG